MSKQHKPNNLRYGSDFFDLTDTEESSSSTNDEVYGSKKPFEIELYKMTKENPPIMNQPPEVKPKKLKKKKKQRNKTPGSESSDSLSKSSSGLGPTYVEGSVEGEVKEEFYDAYDSFHVLPETQVSNSIPMTPALALAHTKDGQNSKEPETGPKVSLAQQASIALREPSSTVFKPISKEKYCREKG